MICRSPQFRVHAEKQKYGVVQTKGSSKVLKISNDSSFVENCFLFLGQMAGEKSMGVFCLRSTTAENGTQRCRFCSASAPALGDSPLWREVSFTFFGF